MEGEGTGTGLNSGVKTTHSNRSDRDSGSRTEMETIRQVQASYGAQALLEAWSGEEEARVRIFLRNKKGNKGEKKGKEQGVLRRVAQSRGLIWECQQPVGLLWPWNMRPPRSTFNTTLLR